MTVRRWIVAAAAAAAGAWSVVPPSEGQPATAAAFAPGDPPAACAGDLFADQIGTRRRDRLRATGRPERLFGLGGDDRLFGSQARVACLFGGPGDDRLDLRDGGGLAYGEAGDDRLLGGVINDQLDGGGGLDAYDGARGDDRIDARDGRPEVVYCGDGNDLVTADRIDVLVGCETVVVNGPDAERLSVPGPPARPRETVRVTMTAPAGGRYRVIAVTTALGRDCLDGPARVASARARAGERVVFRLRPPRGERWCPGAEKAAVVRQRGRRPPKPVARLTFATRR